MKPNAPGEGKPAPKISLTEAARIARGNSLPPSVPIRFDGDDAVPDEDLDITDDGKVVISGAVMTKPANEPESVERTARIIWGRYAGFPIARAADRREFEFLVDVLQRLERASWAKGLKELQAAVPVSKSAPREGSELPAMGNAPSLVRQGGRFTTDSVIANLEWRLKQREPQLKAALSSPQPSDRLTAAQWRNEAFETCAVIAERYEQPFAAADMRAMKSATPVPVSSPQQESAEFMWIPCEQELPSIGQTVIVQGGIAYRVEDEWISQTGGASGRPIMWPVTHWAKIPDIPAPPVTAEGKDRG